MELQDLRGKGIIDYVMTVLLVVVVAITIIFQILKLGFQEVKEL